MVRLVHIHAVGYQALSSLKTHHRNVAREVSPWITSVRSNEHIIFVVIDVVHTAKIACKHVLQFNIDYSKTYVRSSTVILYVHS